ncbi:MAG: hypothetical protein MK212_19275, partial [Saprospiraceae bacterium]|nr:hypothetical protein [Saprospiraceae bacterium]
MKTIEQHLIELENTELEHPHPHKIIFTGNAGQYFVLGNLPMDLGSLRITLQFHPVGEVKVHTTKIDLYNTNQISKLSCYLLENNLVITKTILEADIIKLAELLQNYREEQIVEVTKVAAPHPLDRKAEKSAITSLKSKHLLKNIDKQLTDLGCVGGDNSRLLAFLISISYKTDYPLHGIVNSTSGAGKSHLINTIAKCIPSNEVISLTRVTSKSLYHYKKDDLIGKLILIQDFEGLDVESQYAFRELQSAGKISTSITRKDIWGEMNSGIKTVYAHFSSLSASTKEIYTDNLSRSVIIKIDESLEQTKNIIHYQNSLLEGKEDTNSQQKAKESLCNMIRVLEKYQVVNPYATKINLPIEAKMLRRLNQHFQYFVLLMTWLHQYQRKANEKGHLIT